MLKLQKTSRVTGCPVQIDIPAFVEQVAKGDFEAAYDVINRASSLPAVCGRVCPQETQCEQKCVRGVKVSRLPSAELSALLRIITTSTARKSEENPNQTATKLQLSALALPASPVGDLARGL